MDSLTKCPPQSGDQATDIEATLQKESIPVPPAFNPNEWASSDDPDNGLNWSLPIKIFHTAVPAAIAFLTTFSATIYLPGIHAIAHEFHVSTVAAIVPLSLFVLGYALGPTIAAPCSETFGRRLVYWTTIPVFALFVIGVGLSRTLPALAICRFFAGLFGSPGLTVGSGTIADIWTPEERTIPMAAFVAAPFVGPTLGALIGSFVVEAKGWRWTQWTTLFFTIAIYIPSLFIRETYKKTILTRRARRSGLLPPPRNVSLRTSIQTARFFMTITLARPMSMLFTEPIVSFFSLYVAFAFAIVYAFYAVIPWIFAQVYGFSISSQGLVFLSLTVGYVGAAGTVIVITRLRKTRRKGKTALNEDSGRTASTPEGCLHLAMVGSIALPVCLFWFGWSANKSVPWIVPMIAIAIYGWGTFLVFISATMYIVNTYGPLYGASAVAANRLLAFLMAAAFPLFATKGEPYQRLFPAVFYAECSCDVFLFSKLGIAWASSLLGFVAALLTPVPWAFFRYGPTLRGMSKYQK